MTDLNTELQAYLRQLIVTAEGRNDLMDRATEGMTEFHRKMNNLRGAHSVMKRDIANFIRDFQEEIQALQYLPEEHPQFGPYSAEDEAMPRIMQHAQRILREDFGVDVNHPDYPYPQGYYNGAAE